MKAAITPSKEEAKQAWNSKNNRGGGFDPQGGDDINALSGCGKLRNRAQSDDDVAIYELDDTWIIVGDAHGPWAVQVGKGFFDWYEVPHNRMHL